MEETSEGLVTLEDMGFILEKQAQLERLWATNELDEVKSILKRRKLECESFHTCRIRLDSFCSKLALSRVQVTGELTVYSFQHAD
jgi:hypothetical protein